MKTSLQPGLRFSFSEVITPALSPPHLHPIVVLSTPDMIRLMEEASFRSVLEHLDPGENTVGTLVNISHEKAAREGETVLATARLLAVEGRRLDFEVSVTAGDVVIGRGTHQRAVVDSARFG